MYIIYEYNTHICGIEHLIVKLSKLKVVSALRFYTHDNLDAFVLTQVTYKNECTLRQYLIVLVFCKLSNKPNK